MTVRSLDGSYLAICPACGYPTWGRGLCAACIAAAPNDGEPTLGVNPGADFGPAAGQAVSHVMRSAVELATLFLSWGTGRRPNGPALAAEQPGSPPQQPPCAARECDRLQRRH